MRKSDAASGAAPSTSILAVSAAARSGDEPTRLVCLALLLAVAALALRIMTVW
jgi:hypothetical protein